MDVSLVEYSMIKYEPRVLAAGALYLVHAIEKRAAQKKAHQNSAHSLGQSYIQKQKEQTSMDLINNMLSKLSVECERPESEIKK